VNAKTACRLAVLAALAAASGCAGAGEDGAAGRAPFPSLYTVPERPPPGLSAAEAAAMIAALENTQAAPETAIPPQPARPPERRAAQALATATPVAPAPALRTWVASVVLAADGGVSAEDRARIAGLAGAQARAAARLLLEPAGVAGDAEGPTAVRGALIEAGWPPARIRMLETVAAGAAGPKVDIFVEY
jgi:hypothetical protein